MWILNIEIFLSLLLSQETWQRRPVVRVVKGLVERRRLGGIVGLGGGVSQKDLPGLEVAGKSTPVVQLLSCI